MARLETVAGGTTEATYVKHLRTLTGGGRNTDVDLYRLNGGKLVVATWNGDGRRLPAIDPDSSPADYGIKEE